jgi:hypothetical protein
VIADQRTNMAELNTVDDLWPLLDETSSRLGWIADEDLRAAMMHVLKQMLADTQADWMHRHLNMLLRCVCVLH